MIIDRSGLARARRVRLFFRVTSMEEKICCTGRFFGVISLASLDEAPVPRLGVPILWALAGERLAESGFSLVLLRAFALAGLGRAAVPRLGVLILWTLAGELLAESGFSLVFFKAIPLASLGEAPLPRCWVSRSCERWRENA